METFVWIWIAAGILLMPLQFLVAAPYGRHTKNSWGPLINNKLGWIIMEIVSPVVFLYFLLQGKINLTTGCIAALFTIHYFHRSIVFPLALRTGKKKMPLAIVLFAIIFNSVNGYLNGDYLGQNPELYPDSYLLYPNFIIGLVIFIAGMAINISSDYYLIGLRKTLGPGEYRIPKGGLFERISCPNHFGEIVEWTGFAILCWNLPALAFAVWTASNLIPRAWQHHKWYHRKFEDYPTDRKAVIPGTL